MRFLEVIKNYSEKKYKILVLLFFIIFFVVGIFSVNAYGYSTDEYAQRDLGNLAVKLILKNDNTIFNATSKYHGTSFTIIADIIERTFRISDIRMAFFIRHCFTFLLFFVSLIFFYFLCKKIFKSWKSGLLGSLFLFLSPRIFVDSFYNPKDLPFLSFFIIAIFTLYMFLETRNIKYAFFHGFATGFAAAMRILGILIPLITILFFIIDFIIERKQKKFWQYSDVFKKIQTIFIYLFVFIAIFCMMMPVLLSDPINNLVDVVKTMSDYPQNSPSLFLGQQITSFEIPRSYLPVWMAVTTPVFYIILFLAGLCGFFAAVRKNLVTFYKENKFLIIAALWFFIPVLGQIILKSNIYGGWKHMYFVYPALLVFAVNGMKWIYDLLKKINLRYYKALAAIAAILIILNLGFISFEMIRMHPYEYAYFNIFAGKDLGVVEQRFKLDYWGLSFKYGLDYILKNDDREKIAYTTLHGRDGNQIEYLFSKSDRDRLVYVEDLADADYYLSIYKYGTKERVDIKNKVHTLLVNGGSLISIYKLK
jgi:hypothetical protein